MGIILRILIVIILLAVQPFLWKFVGDRARQLHSNQTNEEQFALLSQKLIDSQKAFSDAQPRLADLSDSFPPATTISQVVGRIEALADTKHLVIELKSIEDGSPVEAGKGAITAKHITASVTGPVESLFSFLEAMEYQKEVLHIDSWDLIQGSLPSVSPVASPQQGVPLDTIFQMTLRMTYYFYDAPK